MAGHKRVAEFSDRLLRIEGHVRGIRRMAEEGRACEEVLIQLAAVRAALEQAGRVLLEDHLETCVIEGIAAGDPEGTISKLKAVLEKIV